MVRIGRYSPTDWNINSIIMNEENERKMINRTSNPLEHFNRKLNDSFATPHPNMMHFVQTKLYYLFPLGHLWRCWYCLLTFFSKA
jgi:hypothetical protein